MSAPHNSSRRRTGFKSDNGSPPSEHGNDKDHPVSEHGDDEDLPVTSEHGCGGNSAFSLNFWRSQSSLCGKLEQRSSRLALKYEPCELFDFQAEAYEEQQQQQQQQQQVPRRSLRLADKYGSADKQVGMSGCACRVPGS